MGDSIITHRKIELVIHITRSIFAPLCNDSPGLNPDGNTAHDFFKVRSAVMGE